MAQVQPAYSAAEMDQRDSQTSESAEGAADPRSKTKQQRTKESANHRTDCGGGLKLAGCITGSARG